MCLSSVSLVVKGHNDHGHSYKANSFNLGGFRIQRFSLLSSACDMAACRQAVSREDVRGKPRSIFRCGWKETEAWVSPETDKDDKR